MSTTTHARTIPDSAASTWSSSGRIAAALCFALAGALWLAADLIGFGLDDIARLRFLADSPALAGIGLTCDALAVPFLCGAVLAWYLLARRSSPRLACIGAVALVFGLTAQAMLNGVELSMYQMMTSGRISASGLFRALGSNAAPSVPGITYQIMFYAGAFAGIIVLMIAVWRSRALPRTAVAFVIAFQLVDLVPIPFPTTVLAAIGLVWMAIAILRSPVTASVQDALPR
ncbi:MAG: hypothetical protein JSS74_07015 [Actinobacteria bacterium]|nr:hypothetical protein [Actinomycetota bacterium]